jgi:hypothetical protein
MFPSPFDIRQEGRKMFPSPFDIRQEGRKMFPSSLKEKKTHPASGRLRRLFVCSFDFEFEDLAAS